MNQHMKQRLVGAVVLVSLAVIFIPMLLDGGEKSGMTIFGSNIPDKPEYRFEPLEIPLEPVEPIPQEKPQLIEKPEPEAEQPAEKPAQSEKTEPATSEAPTKPLVSKAPPSPKAAPSPKPAAEKEPVAWVVQVGSFSSSDNALRLRDKLRAKGYKAFVEKLKTAEGTIYRVRIGPELKREDAEAKLDTLQKDLKLKGIVMGHSS